MWSLVRMLKGTGLKSWHRRWRAQEPATAVAAPKAWASHWASAPQHPARSLGRVNHFASSASWWEDELNGCCARTYAAEGGFPPRSAEERLPLLPSGLYLCCVGRKSKVHLVMAAVWFTSVLGVFLRSSAAWSLYIALSTDYYFLVFFLLVLFSFFTFSALSATSFQWKIATVKILLSCCLYGPNRTSTSTSFLRRTWMKLIQVPLEGKFRCGRGIIIES